MKLPTLWFNSTLFRWPEGQQHWIHTVKRIQRINNRARKCDLQPTNIWSPFFARSPIPRKNPSILRPDTRCPPPPPFGVLLSLTAVSEPAMFPALSSFFPFSRRSGRFRDSRWPDQVQVWLKTPTVAGTPSLSGFEGLFAIGRLCTGALWYGEVRLLSWYLTSLFEKQMQGSHSDFVSYLHKYYNFIIDQLSHLKCKIIEASKTRTFQKCAFTHHQKVGEVAKASKWDPFCAKATA